MCHSASAYEHLWGVCWAQNQENANGMRIRGDLPWQQRNTRREGGTRIKAWSSSQQEEKKKDMIKHHAFLLLEPSASALFIFQFRHYKAKSTTLSVLVHTNLIMSRNAAWAEFLGGDAHAEMGNSVIQIQRLYFELKPMHHHCYRHQHSSSSLKFVQHFFALYFDIATCLSLNSCGDTQCTQWIPKQKLSVSLGCNCQQLVGKQQMYKKCTKKFVIW